MLRAVIYISLVKIKSDAVQSEYDAKIGNLLLQRKKTFLPKYRNLYNFRTINLHELYKFTAVHHNIPKEKKLNTIKVYWHERSQDRQLFILGKLRFFFFDYFMVLYVNRKKGKKLRRKN